MKKLRKFSGYTRRTSPFIPAVSYVGRVLVPAQGRTLPVLGWGVCPSRTGSGRQALAPQPFPLLSSLGSAPTSRGPGLGAAITPAAASRSLAASPAAQSPRCRSQAPPLLWTDQSRDAGHGCTQSTQESPAIACGSRPQGCSSLRTAVQGWAGSLRVGWGPWEVRSPPPRAPFVPWDGGLGSWGRLGRQ